VNRTIISLTILAVSAATSGAQGHGGHHHGGGHHVGGSHHHGGGYGVAVGMPSQMGIPFQPTFNPGQIWLQTGQAAVNYQVAYGMYLDNRLKAVIVHFERRQLNAACRAKMRHPSRTNPQIEALQSSTPRQTTTVILLADGEIAWPALLCDERYRAQRDALEAVMTKRPASPSAGLDRDDSRQVELSCMELRAKLARHARDANSNDWIEAKRFVESVAAEAGR
jgi:hypothetical protein